MAEKLDIENFSDNCRFQIVGKLTNEVITFLSKIVITKFLTFSMKPIYYYGTIESLILKNIRAILGQPKNIIDI